MGCTINNEYNYAPNQLVQLDDLTASWTRLELALVTESYIPEGWVYFITWRNIG